MPPEARDAFATVGELRLHYRVWGDDNAAKLVLLHGVSGNTYVWDEFAEAMCDRFQVFALDARGHGESDWARDRNYSSLAMAGDVAGWAADLGLERLSVVGHSMGAGTGRYLAAGWPSLVERFANVDSGPTPDPATIPAYQRVAALIKAATTASFASLDEARDFLMASEFFRSAAPGILDRRVLHMTRPEGDRWVFRFDAAGILSQPPESRPSPDEQWATFTAISCPTFIVRGANSGLFTRSTGARMVELLPGSKFVEVPDAGHGVQQDNPPGFLAAVRPFLLGED